MVENEIDPELLEEAKKRSKWLTYKDKQIYFQDYRNLRGDEIARLIPAFTEVELNLVKEGSVQLLDFTNSFATKEAITALSNVANLTKHLYEKTAVLGITGIKKILLNAVNKVTNLGAKAFINLEEAQEWLII